VQQRSHSANLDARSARNFWPSHALGGQPYRECPADGPPVAYAIDVATGGTPAAVAIASQLDGFDETERIRLAHCRHRPRQPLSTDTPQVHHCIAQGRDTSRPVGSGADETRPSAANTSIHSPQARNHQGWQFRICRLPA
jgi:hypothetical protein